MIVDKELSVSNRRKADIVQELRKKQFRPFPKVAKAKAAGETEDVVEEEEEEGQVGRRVEDGLVDEDHDERRGHVEGDDARDLDIRRLFLLLLLRHRHCCRYLCYVSVKCK